MGFASVNARLGGLAAPLITTLGEISPVLPPVSFGATSVLAGMAVICFLTETRNVPLVETIAAMESRSVSYGTMECGPNPLWATRNAWKS